MPPTKFPVPVAETPEDRFKRVVSPRVNRTLHELEKIEKAASNLNRYEYSEAERRRIVDALRRRVDAIDLALERGVRRRAQRGRMDAGFRL